MKVESLKLENFKCFKDFKLNFKKPINLIFGENATGKSTIAQAVELALSGKLNGVSSDFRTRHFLVKQGEDNFTLSLKLDGLEVIQKTDPKESTRPDSVFNHLKTDRETLTALLDTRNFLNLHPDEKKRIIFDLLDLKVDQSNIRRKLKSWLKEQLGVMRKYQVSPDEDLISLLDSPPKSLEEAYSQAFEERKLIKREIKALGEIPEVPESITSEKIETEIEQYEKELASFYSKIGEYQGIAEGEKRQIEREIKEVSAEILRLEPEVKSFNQEAETERLSRLENDLKDTLKEIQSLKEELDFFQREMGELQAKREGEEKLKGRLKEFQGRCPLFDEPIECKTEAVLNAVSTLISTANEKSEVDKEISALEKKISKKRKHLQEKEDTISTLKGAISNCKSGLFRFEETRKKIAELKEKRSKLSAVLSSLNEAKLREKEEIKTEIYNLESEIKRKRDLLSTLKKLEKKKSLKERLNKLEVLTLAFSPKGIMESLLNGATSELLSSANQLMNEISGGRYTIEIDIQDGFHIYLCDHKKKAKTEVSHASSSERFRVGIVLQAVLSEISGLRFMVIDGVDILDQANKGFFFRFLRMIAERFDQVIALCTIGQHPPKDPNLPEVDFFVIEDGRVKKLAMSNEC